MCCLRYHTCLVQALYKGLLHSNNCAASAMHGVTVNEQLGYGACCVQLCATHASTMDPGLSMHSRILELQSLCHHGNNALASLRVDYGNRCYKKDFCCMTNGRSE